jgi:hypothetical protein
MKCEDVREHFVEFVYRDLDSAIKAQIDKHLLSCAACQQELEAVREVLGPHTAIMVTNQLLKDALDQNAIGLEVATSGTGCEVRIEDENGLHPHTLDMEPLLAVRVMTRLRQMASVDAGRDTARGEIPVHHRDAFFGVQASFARTAEGETARLSLRERWQGLDLYDIPFSDTERSEFKRLLEGAEGIVLLVGNPFPNLRRTRLAIASHLSQGGRRKVYDIEEFTPGQIAGIHSLRSAGRPGLAIKSAIAAGADVLSVAGLIRSPKAEREIMEKLFRFAREGHLVILEFHADDLTRLLSDFRRTRHAEDLARSLRVAIHQRDIDGTAIFAITTANKMRRAVLEGITDSKESLAAVAEPTVEISFGGSVRQRVNEGLLNSEALNRFRPLRGKASRVVEQARRLAASNGNETYDTLHVLLSILTDLQDHPDEPARKVLEAIGVDVKEMKARIEAEALKRQGEALQPSCVYASPRVENETIPLAQQLAEDESRKLVNLAHLLRALLSTEGIASRYLGADGITLERFEAKLREIA